MFGDGSYSHFLADSLWQFNIAIENIPFIVDLPIQNGDFQ